MSGSRATLKMFREGKAVSDEVRIGVFICGCGGEIDRVIDVRCLGEGTKPLHKVVHVGLHSDLCSSDGLRSLKRTIAEQNINRVVLAGCTPRLYGGLFRQALAETGLPGDFLEMVNIREQCAWVHAADNGSATSKAYDLLRMGIARASLSQAIQPIVVKVAPAAMVIGAGIAGMTAALGLANRGVPAKLVEKENAPGGLARGLNKIYPTFADASKLMEERISAVKTSPNIDLMLNARLCGVSGHVGEFTAEIESPAGRGDFKVGAIILATGAQVLSPEGLFGYNGADIITQWELECRLKSGPIGEKQILMIQCVGSRNSARPYCSRICCPTAIKNAVLIKKSSPESSVTIAFRDIPVEYEKDFKKAAKDGIRFVRYDSLRPPELENGRAVIHDTISRQTLALPFSLVVLSTPLVPAPDAPEMARLLRIPMDEHNFLLEEQIKLRPKNLLPGGIFLAGCVHWPASMNEAMAQGLSAAARAYKVLASETLVKEGLVASIDPRICRGCGRCVEVCPYKAISLIPIEAGLLQARLDQALCQGCGACAVVCSASAISLPHFAREQVEVMLEAATS